MARKLVAEFLGTFWLVLGGCGTAILAANHVGVLGVALAFGLAVLTGAYAFGHVSGGHFNPAVSLGLWLGGRFRGQELLPYVLAQLVGAAFAGWLLFQVARGQPYFTIDVGLPGAFASNGYAELSPFGYSLEAAFIVEAVLTACFLMLIMGATHNRVPAGFAPIAIGLGLTLIHLISIPVTNTSVNPARSTGVALFAGEAVRSQLWLFWVAPLLGGAVGGLLYRTLWPCYVAKLARPERDGGSHQQSRD